MSKKEQPAFGRVWLNPDFPTLTGFVAWSVGDDERFVSASLKISDCSRTVELDFAFDRTEEDQDSYDHPSAILAKVERLYREVRRFRDAMRAEIDK